MIYVRVELWPKGDRSRPRPLGHLNLIDEIEGHPGRYRREEISVKMGDSTPKKSVRARAWIYLMTEQQARLRSQKIVARLDWRKRHVD